MVDYRTEVCSKTRPKCIVLDLGFEDTKFLENINHIRFYSSCDVCMVWCK